MKRAESEIPNGVGRAEKETDPELGVRIISDVGRIVSAEARLLEINIIGAAQSLVDRIYLAAVVVVVAIAGVVSIIASVVVLLHRWMPWWEVLGIVGVTSIVLAEILRRALIPPNVPVFQASMPRGD